MSGTVAPIADAPKANAPIAVVPKEPNRFFIVDKDKYDVVEGPSDATQLVLVAKENVLGELKIDKIVKNLNRTDDLLHIAACGVAGFVNPQTSKSLSAQVMDLQYKLRTNTGEMGSALLEFGESSKNMLPILRGAFKDLYSLYELDAVTRLQDCATVATGMAATSDRLKGTFQGLAMEAQLIAEDTTQTRDLHEKAREAAIARQNEIKRQDAALQATKAHLATQIPQVKGWYEEAKAAQNTADGRMFTLAIVGGVTKALGSAITAGLQFKAAP